MKTRLIAFFAAVLATMPACTKLNSGDSFNQLVDGVEYKFEVIVSKMTYVRVTPVYGPEVVRGDIKIPATAKYDGVTYMVTQIGRQAFKDYTGITSVELPATLSVIEREAFSGCTSLEEINTPQPLSVIEKYAFENCVNLEEFSLEASISTLEEGAFKNCVALEELEFTPTFSQIPVGLCQGCVSLEEIVLPSTIMAVGAYAFDGCSSAKRIVMDASVQSIGDYAFYGCSAVESIVTKTSTPPVCGEGVFGYIDPYIPVTVPMASVAAYQAANGWGGFANITGKY